MRNAYLLVGIIVVILVALIFMGVLNRLPQFGKTGVSIPTPTPIVEGQKNSIVVSPHTPAKIIVVDLVTLTKPGFVAVYEEIDGQPANLLGVSELLAADTYENLTISLSRKTKEAEVLVAIVHLDNGDGTFQYPQSDEPAKDEIGSPVQAKFEVSSKGNGARIPATGLSD